MMGKRLPETCWADLVDQWIIVASSRFFYITLPSLMVHGHTQIKFTLLVFVTVTVYHNVCQRYCNFTAGMVCWSKGWTSYARFGGRNFTVTLLIIFVTEWLVALSRSSRVFPILFLLHDSDLQTILQKLLGSSMCFYWNASLLKDVWCLYVVLWMHRCNITGD